MLNNVKGVGSKTLTELKKLNIYNIEDLLTYYPYRYNYYKPQNINIANENTAITITGTIESIPKVFYFRKNFNRLTFKLLTNNQLINITIFNRAFIKPYLLLKKEITVIGKYTIKNNTLTASDIKLIPITKDYIEPVYHLIQTIKKQKLINLIKEVLSTNPYLIEYIPEYLLKKYKFLSKAELIKSIHFPNNITELKKSKVYFIYEELFIFMLKINYLKNLKNKKEKYKIKKFDYNKAQKIIDSLPYKLTSDQVNVIEEIKDDFNSSKIMNRILIGDVGSGKTIVSFMALYMNYLAGYQGILMVPTEVLSRQHYSNITKLFPMINIKLITSSISKSERINIIEELKDNKIDILIGTHSLLNTELIFNNLGLIITDEQHRFGVKQRQLLQEKGNEVEVLYMSATPIPRTLALTIYGDMDISQIVKKPQNRNPVETVIKSFKEIKPVLSLMLSELKKGHQVFVIAPLIDDENENSMESVNKLYDKINMAFKKKIPIDILHGKLKQVDKDKVMENFKINKTKILISTTVIEVGIDIENATMMVIFNAERFGLATLHQLRGRVGRNELDNYCYLISNYNLERLKILEESNDGFYISEKDFELRGTGDIFGTEQSGDVNFKIADLNRDYKILIQCKKDSEDFLKMHYHEINKYPNLEKILKDISIIN